MIVNYTTSAMIRRFDTMVDQMADTLDDLSEHGNSLSGTAVQLEEAVNRLFLPNVHNGIVSASRRDVDGDGIALVLLDRDKGQTSLAFDRSLQQPTAQRRQTYGEMTMRNGDIVVSMEDAHSIAVTSVFIQTEHPEYVSRPVLLMDARLADKDDLDWYNVADCFGLHELLHAVDINADPRPGDMLRSRFGRAVLELRGYHVTHEVYAFHESDRDYSQKARQRMANTMAIELARQQQTTPDMPFLANDYLMNFLESRNCLAVVESA